MTRCAELVDDAVSRGATVLTGGTIPDREGFFYPATVLKDVPADSRVCHEEIFGPVAPIIVCDDVDEMLDLANDTQFGLMAVNVGVASDPAAPFGGVKESGIGREGSHEGLSEYLELKYVRLG